jgi:hypothetical protein
VDGQAEENMREVDIEIGRRTYSLYTALSEAEFSRVADIMSGAAANLDNADQEHVMLLACLRLAYGLDRVSSDLALIEAALKNHEEQGA